MTNKIDSSPFIGWLGNVWGYRSASMAWFSNVIYFSTWYSSDRARRKPVLYKYICAALGPLPEIDTNREKRTERTNVHWFHQTAERTGAATTHSIFAKHNVCYLRDMDCLRATPSKSASTDDTGNRTAQNMLKMVLWNFKAVWIMFNIQTHVASTDGNGFRLLLSFIFHYRDREIAASNTTPPAILCAKAIVDLHRAFLIAS